MAIAVDATSSNWNPSGTSATGSHTCSGDNRLLLVMGYVWNGSGSISSITYNGDALTEIGQQTADGTNGKVYMFGILNPDTGSNTISVNTSATMQIFYVAVSYTGVDQGTAIGSLPKIGNSSTSIPINTDIGDTLTTTAAGSWMVKVVRDPSNGIQAGTAPSVARMLQPISQDSGSCVDTGEALGAAGSYTLYHQHWAITSNSHRMTVAFAPVATAATFTPRVSFIM